MPVYYALRWRLLRLAPSIGSLQKLVPRILLHLTCLSKVVSVCVYANWPTFLINTVLTYQFKMVKKYTAWSKSCRYLGITAESAPHFKSITLVKLNNRFTAPLIQFSAELVSLQRKMLQWKYQGCARDVEVLRPRRDETIENHVSRPSRDTRLETTSLGNINEKWLPTLLYATEVFPLNESAWHENSRLCCRLCCQKSSILTPQISSVDWCSIWTQLVICVRKDNKTFPKLQLLSLRSHILS